MIVCKILGVDTDLEVFEDKLTITPKGVLGFLNKGLKGIKTIPFTSITAVQHKLITNRPVLQVCRLDFASRFVKLAK